MTEKEQKDLWDIVIIVIMSLLVAFAVSFGCTAAHAQDVVRNGNQFEQVSKRPKAKEILTKYHYIIDGKKYPIFLSSKRKAFIKRISAKSGKEYRQYLPEVTKQIAKENGR